MFYFLTDNFTTLVCTVFRYTFNFFFIKFNSKIIYFLTFPRATLLTMVIFLLYTVVNIVVYQCKTYNYYLYFLSFFNIKNSVLLLLICVRNVFNQSTGYLCYNNYVKDWGLFDKIDFTKIMIFEPPSLWLEK